MAKIPDDDDGGILMPILVSLLVVVGIGTAGLFGLIGYIGHNSAQNQYGSSSTGDASQVRSQAPAQPMQNQVEDSGDSSQLGTGKIETNIDMDSIEKSISDKVPQECKSSEWFIVNCDSAAEGTAFVDMQIDQGNDDMDAALSLSEEYYEIAKNQIENAGIQLESFNMTIVNGGSPIGLFSTVDGENFTVISNGKKSKIDLSDRQAQPEPQQDQAYNGGEASSSGATKTITPNPPTEKPKTSGAARGETQSGGNSITNEITGSLSRTAYWVESEDSYSYHFSSGCRSLSRSTNIKSGTLQDALNAGKTDPCNNCAGGG